MGAMPSRAVTKPQPAPGSAPGASAAGATVPVITGQTPLWERAHRSSSAPVAGGVCQGLAEYWDVDPLLVRVLAVLLGLSMGVGVVLYAAAWVLMPAPDGPSIAARHLPRLAALHRWQMLVLLVVVWAVTAPLLSHVTPFGLAPAAIVALAWWMARRSRRRSARAHRSPRQLPAPPASAAATATRMPSFDPYQVTAPAAPSPGVHRTAAPRTAKSWPLLGLMLVLAAVAGAIGLAVPVPHRWVLAISMALAVVASFQLAGSWTRRPPLGVTLGLTLALALTGAAAVPRAGIPDQVVSGSPAQMSWHQAAEIPDPGITVTGTRADIDASRLTLTGDRSTTVAAIGSDVTITIPKGLNVTVIADTAGATLTTPDKSVLAGGGSTEWTGPHLPGAPTWTLHVKAVGATVEVMTP